MNFIWVFLGGGLGSLTRYVIGLFFQKSSFSLPIATLCSNVVACIIFAASLAFMSNKGSDSSTLKLLLLTGFCGGLSTFSTFGYETWMLLKQNDHTWAFVNIALSLVLCLGAFALIKR